MKFETSLKPFVVAMACVCAVLGGADGAERPASRLALGRSPSENRAAIQREIDAVSAAGGGRVTIPAGEWLTGSLELKDGVELCVPKGAVLRGSTDRNDYNRDDVFPENPSSAGEEWSGGHLVWAYGAKDIAITGGGTIDGNGPAFFGECQYHWRFPYYKYGIKLFPTDREWFRPGFMVALFQCRGVRLEDVTLANTPCWTCHIRCSDGVAIRGVTVDADRTIANSDGFSIDCTRNVTVEKCVVRSGDDSFAIRAACDRHAATNLCENIVVRDCDVWGCCHAVLLGIGTGTIRNVAFEDCRFHEAANSVAFMPAWVEGGRNTDIENVRFTRCFLGECERPVVTWMPNADAHVKDVLFEDCEMESLLPCELNRTEKAPVENVRFVRCRRKTLLEGFKVRQDIRWLDEKRAAIRRNADLFMTGNADVKLADCTPVRGEARGVLLLSFDDRNFDDWVGALPLFDRYGAHATFFVSGEITDPVVRKLKTLRAHGHSVGLHGLNHLDADTAIAKMGAEAYYDAEVARPRRTCSVSYVPVSSFAYANCRRTEEADQLLYRRGFERVRGGVKGATPYDPDGKRQANRKPLVENEEVFFPAKDLPKHRLVNTIIMGEAYHTDIEEICDCLRRAAKNREVICITSHGITSGAKHINMKTEWLETMLKVAKELDLRVLGFDELPPPEK